MQNTEKKSLVDCIDQFYSDLSRFGLQGSHAPFLPVLLELVDVEKIPDIDLFLPQNRNSTSIDPHQAMSVFRKKGLYMSQMEITALQDNEVPCLYVSQSDGPAFTGYVERLLSALPASSALSDEAKVELLHRSALQIMSDLNANPSRENIQRGVKAVSGFVYTLMKDPKAYSMLLRLSNHDQYTLQHSVGVSTNSIILAHKCGMTDERLLIEVGVGGLLHDIGKTKVSEHIINKRGPLDEAEWKEMKQHPQRGYEMVQDNPDLGTRAKLAIWQHHEEPAGTGYPLGLKENQTDLFAKIVTLSDIYNALTTDRTYSSAKPPFEAFKIIKEKLFHKIDPELFEKLVLIYGSA